MPETPVLDKLGILQNYIARETGFSPKSIFISREEITALKNEINAIADFHGYPHPTSWMLAVENTVGVKVRERPKQKIESAD